MKPLNIFVCICSICFSITCASESVQPVSLVNLISNPTAYDKLTVKVTGFFDRGMGTYLFLTEQHAKSMDHLSGVMMSDSSEGDIWRSECKSRFVRVTGTFILADSDLTPLLKDITSIYDPKLRSNCWELGKP